MRIKLHRDTDFIYLSMNNQQLIVFFSSLHDYLLSEEILAKASFHIGTKEIILTEVGIDNK